MLGFSVASFGYANMNMLRIIILISTYFILIKKTSFEHCCCMLSNIHQTINIMGSGFPPTSGQIPQTSGPSD